MKTFFRQLIFFIPIPLLLVSVNYYKDPANLFNTKYESGIADFLVQNINVTNVINYNERSLQKQFIEKLSYCPTEIVLGSSRVMQINSSFAPNERLINNSVSGATMEDDIAIFSLYEKKSCKINKVLIGLDPWLLNDNHDQKKWKFLVSEYYSFLAKISKSESKGSNDFDMDQYEQYAELFSFSYFSTSVYYLMEGIEKSYIPTKQQLNKGFTRVYDGSITYDSVYRTANEQQVEERVRENIAQPSIYSLRDFAQLSKHYQFIFTKFIDYLKSQHIEVEFFLAPYHPSLYDYFKENKSYQNVFASENYYVDFALKHKIKVVGSFDPAKSNLDKSFFYDAMHCNEMAMHQIFSNPN